MAVAVGVGLGGGVGVWLAGSLGEGVATTVEVKNRTGKEVEEGEEPWLFVQPASKVAVIKKPMICGEAFFRKDEHF